MRQLITRSGAALTFYSEPRLTFVWPYSAALQGSDITSMNASKVDIIDLTGVGLPRQDCQKAAVWMAKAFAQARKPNPACFHAGNNHTYRTMTPKAATPALTMFFGGAPYESNVDMHEKFWSSHLDRVAVSGMLIGAREDGEWRGFRAFFKPGKSRLPYVTDYVREAKRLLHVRTHENILPFYIAQGYRLIASPIYTLAGSDPFKVHFMIHDTFL
ncbi:hypothetical protein SCUP515_12594 [Seiridium cupressi]